MKVKTLDWLAFFGLPFALLPFFRFFLLWFTVGLLFE